MTVEWRKDNVSIGQWCTGTNGGGLFPAAATELKHDTAASSGHEGSGNIKREKKKWKTICLHESLNSLIKNIISGATLQAVHISVNSLKGLLKLVKVATDNFSPLHPPAFPSGINVCAAVAKRQPDGFKYSAICLLIVTFTAHPGYCLNQEY